MARLRYNGLVATLGGTGLTSADTTVTFTGALTHAGGTNVPTVAAPDYLPLAILNGDGVVSEVVYLTAYTAAATSGTITRAQESTSAGTHQAGASVVHGPTRRDFNGRDINAQTGTAYTLTLGDAGNFVTLTNAAAITLTVPPNSSAAYPVGTYIEGAQLGAGQVTIVPGVGVTINAAPGLKVAEQYGTFGLLKTGTDSWLAFGRLAA